MGAQVRKRQGQQTAVTSSPGYLQRLERCLSYLVWQLELLGTQPKAIDALVALGKRDPIYYAEITGRTWELRPGTFESYLKQLPPEIKKQAKKAFLERKAAERAQRRR